MNEFALYTVYVWLQTLCFVMKSFILLSGTWTFYFFVSLIFLTNYQMEDDVEVELELEKQLALAHELFPANFRKVDPYFPY